jgi:hypothetical protein
MEHPSSSPRSAALRPKYVKTRVCARFDFPPPRQVVEGRRSGAISDKAVIDQSIAPAGVFVDQRMLSAACQVARQPFLLHCTPFIQLGGWGRYYFQVIVHSL